MDQEAIDSAENNTDAAGYQKRCQKVSAKLQNQSNASILGHLSDCRKGNVDTSRKQDDKDSDRKNTKKRVTLYQIQQVPDGRELGISQRKSDPQDSDEQSQKEFVSPK